MRSLLYGSPRGVIQIAGSFVTTDQTVETLADFPFNPGPVKLLAGHVYLASVMVDCEMESGAHDAGIVPWRLADGTGQTVVEGATWTDGKSNLGGGSTEGNGGTGLLLPAVDEYTPTFYVGPTTPSDESLWFGVNVALNLYDLGVFPAGAGATVVT